MCVEHRQSVLANDAAFEAFKTAAGKLQHWRVLAATEDREAKLGNCSAALKRWMREQLNASWDFQPGCFDRLLRSDESLHEKWLYVRENPVRAGLVKYWKDWSYQIGLDDV